MSASYKVWHCSYRAHGSYGWFQDYDCVVVAEIESKALGMALMKYPDTNAKDWSAQEIPLTEGVFRISSNSN